MPHRRRSAGTRAARADAIVIDRMSPAAADGVEAARRRLVPRRAWSRVRASRGAAIAARRSRDRTSRATPVDADGKPAPRRLLRPAPSDAAGSVRDPPGQDPVLAEQVAESLVDRAQELLDAKVYARRQAARGRGARQEPERAGGRAREAHHQAGEPALGIKDEPAEPTPPPGRRRRRSTDPAIRRRPIERPTADRRRASARRIGRDGSRRAVRRH